MSNMNYGLYFHVPFCVQKCSYCDFLSFPINKFTNIQVEKYFDALISEIENKINIVKCVDSIFIGGGTPSIVSPEYIEKLINCVRAKTCISDDAEISIEVNPGTVTREHFISYKKIGINRISIGVQSTHDRLLKSMGRIHNFNEAMNAINLAQSNGFDNINCDLIFAVPKVLSSPAQTINELEEDIDNLISLGIKHISAYSIILEDETTFSKMYDNGDILFIDDSIEREMYYIIQNKLNKYSLKQYEISNFAFENYKCAHNIKYWKCLPYLGFGMGAASYYNQALSTDYIRESCISTFDSYINKNFKYEKEVIDIEEQMNEFMMLGFRMLSGPDDAVFINRFGKSYFEIFKEKIITLKNKGLVDIDKNVKLSKKGLDFANEVFREFINI